MTPFVETRIPEPAIAAWRTASRLIGSLPKGPNEVRCHELARAVARVVGGDVVDGHYGIVAHSWIVIEERILDPYQPGSLPQCVLHDVYPTLPHVDLYRRGEPRDDIDAAAVDQLASVFQQSTVALAPRLKHLSSRWGNVYADVLLSRDGDDVALATFVWSADGWCSHDWGSNEAELDLDTWLEIARSALPALGGPPPKFTSQRR